MLGRCIVLIGKHHLESIDGYKEMYQESIDNPAGKYNDNMMMMVTVMMMVS